MPETGFEVVPAYLTGCLENGINRRSPAIAYCQYPAHSPKRWAIGGMEKRKASSPNVA